MISKLSSSEIGLKIIPVHVATFRGEMISFFLHFLPEEGSVHYSARVRACERKFDQLDDFGGDVEDDLG